MTIEAELTVQTDDVRTSVGSSHDAALLEFGCDYNPEQWPREVWAEDMRLMREAGVNLVAINIFGWASIQPKESEFDFEALDAIIELLHQNHIGVNLGTGTSSPPPWLSTKHPEILPVVDDGTTRWPGGRQAWCPSSPVFRRYAFALTEAVAIRYGQHPAVKLWHVSNELGCHNAYCFCDVSAGAFRRWLIARYATLDSLNTAWGTAFWSQRYSDWSEILPPRLTLSTSNPTQQLDFDRFSSDELLSYYIGEAEILRRHSSAPVTTNFMVTAHITSQDYWQWAPHVDIVANDHYLDHRLASPLHELSFAADATRGLALGSPWILMEQSVGAVNWQPRNLAKVPGEMMRNSLTHVARGADGVCFFQWRASIQGSEKFHSAMLPHAGEGSEKFSEVLELGAALQALKEIRGSRVVSQVALVFSWEAWWATDLDSRPSEDVRYIDQVHRVYTALWELGVTVDVVQPGADLSAYALVVVPCLYLVTDRQAQVIEDYASSGGHVVVTFFSGIVDEDDRVRLGGYPGAFRELLGVSSEEFQPLAGDESRALSSGARGHVWTEVTSLRGAETVASYESGSLAGRPAVTRNSFGEGVGWYLGTQLDAEGLTQFLATVVAEAGVHAIAPTRGEDVEVVIRRSDDNDYVFVINHGDAEAELPAQGFELLHSSAVDGALTVPPGEVRVVRTAHSPNYDTVS
ncbi:beta-galactosidase [Subtercola sp. PAMC28395]|uniref:beta-galactosidase n=1 Tax=Subtercola sp. PAMC28395 TaxID=2846775 RepID=UPI001C0E24E1|nr:beta-galactosidase [Subtercola sp. PAMC28395]QWT22792.1 beta-galactosidase [Subtercola sp. PAMC28395]